MSKMRLVSALAVLALTSLWGCGGGGGVGGKTDDPPKVDEKPTGTALFRVDLESGKVDIQSLTPESRAVFAGSAVTFTSSNVLNEGTLARRRLQVSMANNQPESLLGPLKVRFTNFKNVTTAPTDLRTSYKVSSIAGTGSEGATDGAALSATLRFPTGVATDPSGTIYFTSKNEFGSTVRMLKNGVVSTLATAFLDPRGLAFVPAVPGHPVFNQDSLIVADASMHRLVRVVIGSKTQSNYAGSGAAGSADNAVLLSATFNQPHGVRLLSAEPGAVSFLVTELAGGRVRRVVDNAAGNDAAPSLIGGLFDPTDAVYFEGALAIVENSAHRVLIWQGNQIAVLGVNAPGFVNGKGDVAQFSSPQSLAMVGRTLFLTESGNRRVRQLDLLQDGSPVSAASWNVATVAGNGTSGSADGTSSTVSFGGPSGIVSVNNGLVLADLPANKLRKITSVANRFPVDLPLGGSTSAELPRLANPTGFLPNETKVPYIEISGSVDPGQSVGAGNWDFIVPSGITAFEFVVSVEAGTSVLAALDGVTNVGPAYGGGSPNVDVRGFAGSTSSAYADGPAAAAAFGSVVGLARSQDGALFVSDSANATIRRIDASGNVTTIAGRAGNPGSTDGRADVALVSSPRGIACEPDGLTVYFAQNEVVRRLALRADYDGNPANGIVPGDPARAASWQLTTIAGGYSLSGFANGDGATARFNGTYGLVRTAPGQLFLTEITGNRVRSMTLVGEDGSLAASWMVRPVAGDANQAAPPNALVDDGSGATVRFAGPANIAVGPDGDLYVTDMINQRVRRVSPGGATTTYAGSIAGYGDATTATNAKLNSPVGIAVDASGVVYVSEYMNLAIRKRATGVQTVAGGDPNPNNTDGNGKVAKFYAPHCLLALPDGGLLVGDRSRIRLIQRIIQP